MYKVIGDELVNTTHLSIIEWFKINYTYTSQNKNVFRKLYIIDNQDKDVVKIIINFNDNKIIISKCCKRKSHTIKPVNILKSWLNNYNLFFKKYNEILKQNGC
jgi:hypothetical protein